MTEDEPEAEAGFLAELSLTDEEEGGGRAECAACLRPASACWCRHLPRPRLVTRTRVLVLQHPGEVRRNIRTCRMLELGLAEGCVQVVRGMKRNCDLNLNQENCSLRNMLALFQVEGFLVKARSWRTRCPGEARVSSTRAETPSLWPRVRLLTVTGTRGEWTPWSFWTVPGTRRRSYTSGIVLVSAVSAKLVFLSNIFSQNPSLQRLRKVHVSVSAPSEYIVRTQPAAGCLSTLEAAAHSLAVLEARPDIVEPLVAPLVAMCNIQIRHGAVAHESRDIKTTRLENSQYQKRKPQFRP